MNAAEILRALDDKRRHGSGDAQVTELMPRLSRRRAAGHSWHSVPYSSLDAETADAAIDGEIEHHRKLGVSFEWTLYSHDTPPDMLNRLQSRGFHIGPCEAVMIFDLAERPAWIDNQRPDVRVRVVATPADVDDFSRVAEAVFGHSYQSTACELAVAIEARSTDHRGYVAYIGAQPVAVGRLYTSPDSIFAGLYTGGTLAAFRGRGIYRAMLAARARDAIRSGAKYLRVDALPTSRPILERLGFVRIADAWPCEWRP